MIAMYVYTLFIQYIWRDCLIPQEKDSAFNISNHIVFLEIQNVRITLVFPEQVSLDPSRICTAECQVASIHLPMIQHLLSDQTECDITGSPLGSTFSFEVIA